MVRGSGQTATVNYIYVIDRTGCGRDAGDEEKKLSCRGRVSSFELDSERHERVDHVRFLPLSTS